LVTTNMMVVTNEIPLNVGQTGRLAYRISVSIVLCGAELCYFTDAQ